MLAIRGDMIRLSGAAYSAGPDFSARFGETDAPETIDDTNRNEMNPVTYLPDRKGRCLPRSAPPRRVAESSAYNMKLFADTSYPEETYSFNASVYTH